MNAFKFTKTALLNLPPPAAGSRLTAYDTQIPKLAIRVTPTGAKAFYVIKRAGSSIAWVKLGSFPEVTVEQARIEAQKILADFAQGANPAEARRASKAEPTLSEFFTEYGKRHGEQKRSWRDDQQRFRDYLQPSIGKRKLSEINREMIARAMSEAESVGRSGATINQIRALASGIFAKAVDWGYLAGNPAQGIKGRKTQSRDRFLQADEMPRFLQALAEEPNATARDFILMALLTGARRENLCAMQWREINLDRAEWRIPRTKNGDAQIIPLCAEAIDILKTRREQIAESFVFPGRGSDHITDPKAAFMRVMKRAGIPYGRKAEDGVTLHDLRRTLGSWQARTGASLVIIGKSLGHKSHQATQIYARVDTDPIRQAMNTATAAMFEAGGFSRTVTSQQKQG